MGFISAIALYFLSKPQLPCAKVSSWPCKHRLTLYGIYQLSSFLSFLCKPRLFRENISSWHES